MALASTSITIENTWESLTYNWDDVSTGGGTGQGSPSASMWTDLVIVFNTGPSFISLDAGTPKKRIAKFTKREKEAFIRVYCKIRDKEFVTKKKKIRKKVTLTVENVRVVLKEVCKIDIKVFY